MSSFVNRELTQATTTERLKGRFESGGLADKYLVLLSEVLMESPQGAVKTVGQLLNMTGNDSQPGERKFEATFSYVARYIVVLSSNWKVKSSSVETYGALKRRLLMFVFDRFFKTKDETLSQALCEESSKNKHLMLSLCVHKEELFGELSKVDLEAEVLNAGAQHLYHTYVDPVYSFTSEVLRKKATSSKTTPLTFHQLKAYFIQYIMNGFF